ncbi:MAG: hypothetical protein JJD92_07505 [Frankiaceae bacterium]|nr:hypothetical protein [Frankiaceae bacterium]
MSRPRTTYAVLGTLLVAFWFLAGIGQGDGASDSAANVGTTFWVCFGVTVLAVAGYTLALGVRALLGRRVGNP